MNRNATMAGFLYAAFVFDITSFIAGMFAIAVMMLIYVGIVTVMERKRAEAQWKKQMSGLSLLDPQDPSETYWKNKLAENDTLPVQD